MGGSGACGGVRSQLGVYLTGSILPADRAVVVRHLASCVACRAELADLAALPALLRRRACQAAAEASVSETPPDAGVAPAPALAWGAAPGPAPREVQLSRLVRSMTRRRRRRRWLLALIAFVLVAVAGTGWALRLAQPPGSQVMATVLETDRVGGLSVLTDAEGYTLYWFGPDNATMSACDASCARTWPPVTAPAIQGAGVTGALGAIARPDGSLQATYDGHPLYTTTVDKEPGQAKGNGVWSDGGQWHEVVVGGG
jgi:predicted lipoprotein with Yx(FWY)xxD motif